MTSTIHTAVLTRVVQLIGLASIRAAHCSGISLNAECRRPKAECRMRNAEFRATGAGRLSVARVQQGAGAGKQNIPGDVPRTDDPQRVIWSDRHVTLDVTRVALGHLTRAGT